MILVFPLLALAAVAAAAYVYYTKDAHGQHVSDAAVANAAVTEHVAAATKAPDPATAQQHVEAASTAVAVAADKSQKAVETAKTPKERARAAALAEVTAANADLIAARRRLDLGDPATFSVLAAAQQRSLRAIENLARVNAS